MSQTFRKYPSTVQFSNVVKHVRDYCKWNSVPLPTITFSGSCKVHGTNSCIEITRDGDVYAQSRENPISYEKDNAGFATWVAQNKKVFTEFFEEFMVDTIDSVYIYGEWFGSSIQKGVAVSQLPEKKFGVFQIISKVGESEYVQLHVPFHSWLNSRLPNVVVIDEIVPREYIQIDFANPEAVQNKLLELTLKVEEECPVGKYFGISGVGEGIVWTAQNVDFDIPKFKTKGEKHSASKVKVLRELTAAEIAAKETATEFVEYACTENRLNQGIDKLGEMGLDVDIKNMGAFLKWVGNDILSEEIDVLLKSGIERKDVMPKIADKARQWFMVYLNSEMGIL